MINVSDGFKAAVRQFGVKFYAYISDGITQVSNGNGLQSLKITSAGNICKTAMRQLNVTFIGDHDFTDKTVNPYMGVLVGDSIEYIDYGTFKVIEQKGNGKKRTSEITAYDLMYESLQKYDLTLEYPLTILQLLQAICTRLDYTLATTIFPNYDFIISGEVYTEQNLTFRDVLEDIAQATGTVIYFNTSDQLVLKVVNNVSVETIERRSIIDYNFKTFYGGINSVVLSRQPQEDNIVMKNDSDIESNGLCEFKILNNKATDSDRESAITAIYDALYGLSYFPFDVTARLGYHEIGDTVLIRHIDDSLKRVVILNIEMTVAGTLKEHYRAETPSLSSTKYQYAGVIGQRIKNTEIKVDKVKGEISLTNESLSGAIAQINITTDNITQSVNSALNAADTNSDNIATLQENYTTLSQSVDNIGVTIQGIGGTNLLKNSVGLKGDIRDWQLYNSEGNLITATNTGTIDQSSDVEINGESGSAITLLEQYIQQTFPTISGQQYTFYGRYKSNLAATLSITGITDLTLPIQANWAVYKHQFTASSDSTTLRISNVSSGAGASITLTDLITKLGDASGWVQAPNEVYGKNFRFDKDGFSITSLTDAFKTLLDNQKLAIYDTAANKIVALFSKDQGIITKLTVQDELIVQRYENASSSARFIPTDTGMMLVINDS